LKKSTENQSEKPIVSFMDSSVIERLETMGGSLLVIKMIDMFANTTTKKIDLMKSALANGEYEQLEREAHSYKSSAGNMGAKKLQQIAEKIEMLSLKKKYNLLTRLVHQLSMEGEKVITYLHHRKNDYSI